MRVFTIIIFFFASSSIVGQIIYEPVYVNNCSDSNINNIEWFLIDNDENIYSPLGKLDKNIKLPRKGYYRLFTKNSLEEFDIFIKEEGKILDTILLQTLVFNQYVGSSNYTFCDSLANGKLEDYYLNENKRIRGTFKNGQPVDTLIEYYESGQIKKVFIPNNEGWESWQYYENGILKNEISIKENFEKNYYETGQIKEIWDRKKDFLRGYYSNGLVMFEGNRKRHKYYSEKGIKIGEIKKRRYRKLEREMNIGKEYKKVKYNKYKMKFFDIFGKLEKVVVFSCTKWKFSLSHSNMYEISDRIECHMVEKIVSLNENNSKKNELIYYCEEKHKYKMISEYFKKKKMEFEK